MARLIHFYREETGEGPTEYVVIDDEGLDDTTLTEEYAASGFKMGKILEIDGDVITFPTNRSLFPH